MDGDILINLDSEDEGELYIGCAGGIDTTGEFTYTPEDVPEDHKLLRELFDYEPVTLEIEINRRIKENNL